MLPSPSPVPPPAATPTPWAMPDVAAESAGPPTSPSTPVTSPASVALPDDVVPPAPIRLPVPLRPMTILDKLDGAFAVIKARPARIVGGAAMVMVPAQVLSAFLVRNNTDLSDQFEQLSRVLEGTTTSVPQSTASDVGMGMLAIAVSSLASMLLGGLVTVFVQAWYAGEDPSLGVAVRRWIRRVPALAGAFAILVPIGLLNSLCLLPALFFIPVFLVVAPAVVAERLGPVAGVGRSWRLTLRRFGSVMAAWLLAFVVESAVGQVLLLLVQLVSTSLPESWRWVVNGMGSGMVSLVVAPFVVSVAVLQYLDLRIRTEGLDLQLRAGSVFPVTDGMGTT